MLYTADFETTTDPEDCRVWAAGICEIDTKKFYYGNTIEWFMDFAQKHAGSKFYFHNLKFDGEFIISWLFENGFTWVKDRKKLTTDTFTTLISDKGQFYSMEICFYKDDDESRKVVLFDSLKIIPFGVEDVARTFGLKIKKLEIDYDKYREPGHKLTQDEIDYLHNDVVIMAKALHVLFDENLTCMTQGSNAMKDYKTMLGKKDFVKYFPPPDYDEDIRKAYKGAFTYVNPKFQGQDVGEGIVLDVNSLYPSVMYNRPLPFGEGIQFEGEYKEDEFYPLYVQKLRCRFELKEGYLPTIQLKNNLAFMPNEYITSSNGDELFLYLTNIDLKIFTEHYDIDDIEFIGGWKFRQTDTLFKKYIDKWNEVKIQSTLEGNKGRRTMAKQMLNSLYGKFALNPNVCSKIPYYDNGIVKYKNGEKEIRSPIYLPVGIFITSWARYITITSAQKVYDRFIYADTDSLHLLGTEKPACLEVDPVKLGAWAHESTFKRARFIRQKTYIEEIDGEMHITCAGMPSRCYPYVTWSNFKPGNKFEGKFQPQHVNGGIVLKEIEFTIKL